MIVNSPRQLLAAIPHLLGFHPDNSLVIVAMCQEEILTIARLDWPTQPSPLPDAIQDDIRGKDKAALVYIAYIESECTLVQLNQLVLAPQEHQLLDALCVARGSWRSLMCDDEDCCPIGGHPLANLSEVDVEFVVAGSAPFILREDLSSKLEAVALTKEQLDARSSAREAVDLKLQNFITNERESPTRIRADFLSELMQKFAVDETWDWQQHALLSAVVRDVHMRDGLLRQMLDHPQMRLPIRSIMISQISRAAEHDIAPLSTTLAGCAWLDGNGALAAVALERALGSDPSYSLARLLDRALRHGVPPSVWIESLEAVSYDECLAGAA